MHDHLSWPYEDRADFLRRVREFLTEGLALGLRCVYAGDRPHEALEEDLASLPDLPSLIARGALTLTVLSDLYPEGAEMDPGETLSTFAAATEDALASGYAGLRVAADATSLVRSPEQLAAFAEWEHRADRYMAEHPLSGLCGFDRSRLPARATVALACLHPVVRAGTTPFQVYSANHHADLALAGELDASVADDFRASLERTGRNVARELVVDGTKLGFVDHRGLESIRDFAHRLHATAVLRTGSATPGRLVEILGLEGIRVESVTAEGALT